MQKLIIERAKWSRGSLITNALLVGPVKAAFDSDDRRRVPVQGNMCCLGFACKQLGGLEDSEILDVAYPDNVGSESRLKLPDWLIHSSHKMASTNDDGCLTEEQRESKLKEQFAEFKVEVEFV